MTAQSGSENTARPVAVITGASWAVDGGMLRMGPMAGSHLESGAWRRG